MRTQFVVQIDGHDILRQVFQFFMHDGTDFRLIKFFAEPFAIHLFGDQFLHTQTAAIVERLIAVRHGIDHQPQLTADVIFFRRDKTGGVEAAIRNALQLFTGFLPHMIQAAPREQNKPIKHSLTFYPFFSLAAETTACPQYSTDILKT